MNVRHLLMLLGVLLFVGLAGCAVTDYDHTVDFSRYKTFAWGESNVDVSHPLYDGDLIHNRIRRAVEEEFFKRGIVKTHSNPDFIVQYHTYTEEKRRPSGVYPYYYPYGFRYYPFGFGWFPYYWMPPPPPPVQHEYTEGTLVLDIIDNDTQELVWRGSVTGNVENVAALRKQIEKGIRAIMKKYPVSPDAPLRLPGEVVS